MMAGEKKWATSRRSGMTVLGKVAVPKPLNLPSQKLENHGLNPNVEIVPKGTLGWGSQSSSVPNAWGSSPKADGSTGSPSHLSGRPSSGSSTRPSTGGNDRTLDPTSNVWGTTSRPSSASGALTSNQTAITTLRPHSAETRSGSSQMSRFAEPPPDNSLGSGPNGASNNLRGTPSNSDGFSLSSGDFPTLGSEKDGSGKNIDSQEYGNNNRPGSSSSKATSVKENTTSLVGNVKGDETVNAWTREDSQHNEHGVQPTAERWHSEFPHGGNPHRPLQHFDAWHGPPMNRPPAGWYGGGPPRGPPYGPPLQPGGFPMEPSPYYRPHFPLQVPHGAAPRGHHTKNGELCRPHVPEGYIHPRMPMNPGFYPPPVAYEGFYGPPMGYCNPNERDMPFMGMPRGPPVYKRHPYENADPHSRSPAYGSRGKPSTPERAPKTGHSDDTRGPYKVLLKQSTNGDEKRADGEWDRGVPSNIPSIKKKDHLREPLQKNEWGLEDDQGAYPSYSTKFPENTGSANAVADYLGNKPGEESSFSQLPQVVSASPRSSTFMHDAKARNVDGPPPDVSAHPFRENRYNQPHTSGGPSRRNSHDAQSRVDYRGKKLNNLDVDGLRNKLHAGKSSAEVSVTNLEASANVLVRHHPNILVESGNSDINLQDKNEAGYSTLSADDSDSFAQRATMREMAKQRAEKLQKEEEERTREQKAKALAKLEELNRRSHIADSSNQKLENSAPRKTAEQEEENSQKSAELNTDSIRSETSSSAIVCNREDQIRDGTSIMVGENTVVYKAPILVPVKVCPNTELINNEFAFQVRDEIVTKNKQTEYKQRQSVNSAKDVIEKSIPLTETSTPNFKAASDGARPENIAIAVSSSGEPCLVTNSLVMTDSSTHHKRKNNSSSKTKHKADVVIPASVVPSTVAKEDYAAKDSTETCELDANVPQSKAAAKHSTQVLEQHSSLTEETIGKGNHQVKTQQSRHMPRNQQTNNRMAEIEKAHSSETVTWAPVRSQNKIELTDKPGDKADPKIGSSNVKVASVMQNNMKHKRAEMERYVPKPVAKDLAQQVSIQQLAATQIIKDTQPGNSVITDADRGAVSKNGDIKRNHSSNAHGIWNQRVYVESALNHGLQEAGKKPIEQNQLTKSDIISSKLHTTDGWNSNVIFDTLVTKGRGVPGQGKQHPFKGDRSTGNTFKLDCGTTVEASSESAPACGMNQIDNKNGSGENRFIGERTPQWKPKTQVYAVHNYQNRTSERQMNNPASETRAGQYHSEPVNVENVAHQDFHRTRNPMSSRGCPRMPYEIPANNRVQSEIVYGKNDQQFPSGVRKYGNHDNRSGRGHEPHGDAAFNRERPRHTSHFEYQPVGQYGINKPNKSEEGVTEGSNNAGPIYRERNYSHPRRGGGSLYGRQSGGSHGDPSYY